MRLSPRLLVRCWGARGSFPSPGPHTLRFGGNTTCIELAPANGVRIVFDAGSGIRALGCKLLEDIGAQRGDDGVYLFLTHRHLDHVLGLPQFVPQVSQRWPVVIRCGNASVAEVETLVAALLTPPLFVSLPDYTRNVTIEPCATGSPSAIGADVRVHRFDARHNGGAAVFRVDDTHGPLFAFAPDNELSYASDDENVVQWRTQLAIELRGVPVLAHDATYLESELAQFAGWGHSSPQEATRFAIECDAKKLLLFHHHPDRTDNAVDALVTECRAFAKSLGSAIDIDAAYEGMALAIN